MIDLDIEYGNAVLYKVVGEQISCFEFGQVPGWWEFIRSCKHYLFQHDFWGLVFCRHCVNLSISVMASSSFKSSYLYLNNMEERIDGVILAILDRSVCRLCSPFLYLGSSLRSISRLIIGI